MTEVVNLRKSKYSVYIGRKDGELHYGNPMSIGSSKFSTLKFATRDEAIFAFYQWLKGERYEDVEPERRLFILNNLESLRGQTLGCFCAPLGCHGHIYEVLLGEKNLEDVIIPSVLESLRSDKVQRPKDNAKEIDQFSLF